LHLTELARIEPAIFGQYANRDTQSADVVQQGSFVKKGELVVGQSEGGAELHRPVSDFLGESRTGVIAILDRAGQRDNDALELIDLLFQLADAQLCSHQRLERGSFDWG